MTYVNHPSTTLGVVPSNIEGPQRDTENAQRFKNILCATSVNSVALWLASVDERTSWKSF